MLFGLFLWFFWLSGGILVSASPECSLWLAPSHTSPSENRIKYGIFVGRDFKQNETLPLPEIAIPLIDMTGSHNRDTALKDTILEFIESLSWTSEYAGTAWEGNHSVPVLIPGIGALPQLHTGISNVEFIQEGVLLRDRQKSPKAGTPHPSRGAITPYYNVTLYATRDIPAGMELFANFGEAWDGNFTNDEYQDTISRHDYVVADAIVEELVKIYNEFPEDVTFDLQQDAMDFILDEVLAKVAGKHAKIIKSLIPENPRKLQKVIDLGGTFMYRYLDMIHSTAWLSSHGYCLDTLRMGQSTIEHAGRGAFATRDFAPKDVITLSPMLHIADKSVLDMYQIETFQDIETGKRFEMYNRGGGRIGRQLLLNYCFGHAESSLLLFPLSSHAALINHSKEPNAIITWSRVKDNGLPNQHAYHDGTVENLARVNRIVSVMKVVAIKDIKAGDEVLLDYGNEWVAAWDSYMRQWEQIYASTPHPLRAEDFRQRYRNKPLPVSHNSESRYSPHVAAACFLHTKERPDGVPKSEGRMEVSDFDHPSDGPLFQSSRMFLVDIVNSTESGNNFYNYTVLAKLPNGGRHKVLNVPHHSCTFVDLPYTSDIHLQGAFRHPIGIPHYDFPQAWRNLR